MAEKNNSDQPLIPTSRISSELIAHLQTAPIPHLSLPAYASIPQAAGIYYREYVRLFRLNQSLNNDLVETISRRNELAENYNHIKRMRFSDEAVRRKRRYARDIERLFFCPIERCNRGYGSEGSLSHHVRLKHMEYYLSGKYQVFIQNYIDQLPHLQRQIKEEQEGKEEEEEQRVKHEIKPKQEVKPKEQMKPKDEMKPKEEVRPKQEVNVDLKVKAEVKGGLMKEQKKRQKPLQQSVQMLRRSKRERISRE